MTFYAGSAYHKDQVSIGPSDLNLLGSISISSDVKDAVEHWVSDAQKREDILYFSVFVEQELVGQILLHDINANAGESLIAEEVSDYHLT